MPSTVESAPISRSSFWAGRVVTAVVVLFMTFDGLTKLMRAPQVIEAIARIGFPESTIVAIGLVLLACTALYLIPQTSVLGAILLTAYLGGATAANVRAGSQVFNTIFPIVFGVLVWSGLFLRDRRLRALIPLRSSRHSALTDSGVAEC